MNPEVLGTIAMLTSLVFMAMGLPVQIFKIYRAESTKGVSLFTTCTLLGTTTAWCVYSLTIGNKYILFSNAPGAFFAFVLLCQFWVYRHNNQAVQGFTLSDNEMDFLNRRGEMWLNRNLLRPPSKGERMQASTGKAILEVSVKEFLVVGKSDEGNYRMCVQKTR